MNPILWLALVIAVSAGWLIVNKWAFDDIVSPFNLLLPAWILPLMLRLLNLSWTERPWETNTLLMVWWTTLAVALISLGASAFLPRNKSVSGAGIFKKTIALLQQPGFSTYLVICFFIGAAGLVYNELITNPIGIPMLTYLQNPDISRDPNWQWKGGGLWPLSIPAFTLTPLLYLKFKIERRWEFKMFYLGLALFYPLVELVKMARSECIYGLTGLALVEYYYRKRFRPLSSRPDFNLKGKVRGLALAVVVGLLALVSATLFQQIRATRPMSTFATSMGMSVDLPEPYASTVVEVYAYFALPFENFSNFVNNYPGEHQLGVGGLRPIYSALGLGSIARARMDEIDFDKYLEMKPVNTYPFLATLYAESGWVGVLVFPVVYAVVVNFLYLAFRARSGVEIMIIYMVFLCYCWVWIFSNQNFSGIQYYLYAGTIFVITFFYRLFWRRRPEGSQPGRTARHQPV